MEHRRLPHWQKPGAAYFVTWRLHGSLPAIRVNDSRLTDGAKFAAADRLLDASTTGPKWLQQPHVAKSVIEVLLQGQGEGLYDLGAWVLMLNHVHLILRPHIDLPRVVAIIKARSAQEGNRLLNRSGKPFWARDYFDRWIRSSVEEARMIRYIEQNPVKAGLCLRPEDWPWTSPDAASAASPSH